jgi:hypothetical protein
MGGRARGTDGHGRRGGREGSRVLAYLNRLSDLHWAMARWLEGPEHKLSKENGLTRYRCGVSSSRVPGGVVHKLPGDLRKALIANATALDAWNDITPLARNEFICWVEDAKQEKTRERRIRRTKEELEEGQRRPCCWPGCAHRERNGK